MKLVYLLPSIMLLSKVFAQAEDEDMERRYKGIIKLVTSQVTTTHTKKELFFRLQNYGCHCFPDKSRTAGAMGSKAVDEKDSLCSELAQCHRCVEMEFPDIDTTNSGYGADIDDVTKAITCKDNEGTGKHAHCLCDSHFAVQMGAIWDDADMNPFFWRSPRQIKKFPDVVRFDPTDAQYCKQKGGDTGMGVVDECCGNYPYSKPFNSNNKHCCESGALASLIEICCDDGSVGVTCI